MLLQPNGSDFQRHSYKFSITDASKVGEARRFALTLATAMHLDEVISGRIGIIVNELGNNLAKYAPAGDLIIRKMDMCDGEESGIEILSVDRGPGMDTSRAVTDGYTTGTTPGTGLGAVMRQADYFDIYSQYQKGTVVVAGVYKTKRADVGEYAIGAVNIPYPGESVSGDDFCVIQNGQQLSILVVDGLGHGINANKAANEAVTTFQNAFKNSVDVILDRVHGRLKSTRGGAVFVINSENGNINFIGVGNIRATVQSAGKTKTLISQNGTAGVQMRKHSILHEHWSTHEYLILHSDGIHSRWDLSLYAGLFTRHPAIIAGIIARDFTRGTDDATVLVIGRKK